MDWGVAFICIFFMVTGTLCTLYAHRIGKWSTGLGFYLFKVTPWLNFTGKTWEEIEHQFYDEWPLRGFWLFWLWVMRIAGVILAVSGAFVLALVIIQSLKG